MTDEQIGIEIQIQNGSGGDTVPSVKVGKLAVLMALVAAAMVVAFAVPSSTAAAKKLNLPYATIDHPQFISASQATFLAPDDLLIGVTNGKIAKAYPAAILAQHGVVQDRMPDGPIAVTW
jgi:hypothetical protein